MKSILVLIAIFWATTAQADPGPRIDVAFVLDATGSMGSYINQARERIRSIAKDLAEGTPAPIVRFALVRFRDKTDAYLTQKNDFTGDVSIMAKWLDETTAKGGGDSPEAVLEGLDVAVRQLSWSQERNVVRLIYLVGDAPPQHYKNGPTVYSVAQEALARGIVIHSIACGGIGRRGRYFFDQLARLSEGRAYNLSRYRRLPRRRISTVAPTKSGLKEAISGSARAYSSSVGVRFSDVGTPAPFETMVHVSAHETTGLLGPHVRYVSDITTWTDMWSAHVSVQSEPDLTAPIVDFHKNAIVILGGNDAGVELVAVNDHARRRVLRVRRASSGVRMYRLASSKHPIVIRWAEEEKS